jgi:hypothetical protein
MPDLPIKIPYSYLMDEANYNSLIRLMQKRCGEIMNINLPKEAIGLSEQPIYGPSPLESAIGCYIADIETTRSVKHFLCLIEQL